MLLPAPLLCRVSWEEYSRTPTPPSARRCKCYSLPPRDASLESTQVTLHPTCKSTRNSSAHFAPTHDIASFFACTCIHAIARHNSNKKISGITIASRALNPAQPQIPNTTRVLRSFLICFSTPLTRSVQRQLGLKK